MPGILKDRLFRSRAVDGRGVGQVLGAVGVVVNGGREFAWPSVVVMHFRGCQRWAGVCMTDSGGHAFLWPSVVARVFMAINGKRASQNNDAFYEAPRGCNYLRGNMHILNVLAQVDCRAL